MGDLLVVLVIAAVVGTVGIAFGIVVLAPRLARLGEGEDEEPGDRPD